VLNILAPHSLRRRLHAGSGVGRAGLLLLFYAAASRFSTHAIPRSLLFPTFLASLVPLPLRRSALVHRQR